MKQNFIDTEDLRTVVVPSVNLALKSNSKATTRETKSAIKRSLKDGRKITPVGYLNIVEKVLKKKKLSKSWLNERSETKTSDSNPQSCSFEDI